MAYENPSIADFKARFSRDFIYGTDPATNVTDDDIQLALDDAAIVINVDLFVSQAVYDRGFLFLAAHCLCLNMREGSQGISGQFNWVTAGKSVGSVSENYSIPQRILDNPEFAAFSKTNYGAQYLVMILPLLSGAVFSVRGRTHP